MKLNPLVGIVTFAALAAVLSVDALAASRVTTRLARTRVTLDWEDMQLDQALKEVGGYARVHFMLSKQLRERGGLEDGISLKLKEAKVSSVLEILASTYDLKYMEKGGVVIVTTPQDAIKRTAVLRVYDVSGLLYTPPDFIGPEIVLRGSEGFEDFEPEPPEIHKDGPSIDEVLDLIRTTTNETQWDFDGVSIGTFGTRKIIVRHTPEMQRKVARVIHMLRGI